MAYNDFNLKKAEKDFALTVVESENLFAFVPKVEISELLQANLSEKISLALAIGTEKARSEFIVADVLLEVRRIFDRQISLFSGIDFTVDASKGLNGKCDFLLSLSPRQLTLDAPVITMVEKMKTLLAAWDNALLKWLPRKSTMSAKVARCGKFMER